MRLETRRNPRMTAQERFLRRLDQPSQQRMPEGMRPLTYADVRSEKIDVSAQRALVAMSQSPSLRAPAAGLARAVQGGQLGGIYRQDQRVPALRAQQLGLGWWQTIPAAQDFILLLHPQQPLAGVPVVAVRNAAANDQNRLSYVLADAWDAFERWRTGEIQSCDDRIGTPFPAVLPILCFKRCPLGPAVRSPVADELILAHRSRWCLPGERQHANCRDLRARCVRRIVIHALAMKDPSATQTAAQNVIQQWKTAPGDTSAHYVIDRDGRITQMVEDHAVAFHAGRPANEDSIGIEHADLCNQPDSFTDRLYRRSAALVRDIAARHGFPINSRNFHDIVIGHDRLQLGHKDPGPFWDWEYYKALVTSPESDPVRVVDSAARVQSWYGRPRGWTLRVTSRPDSQYCPDLKQSWGSLNRFQGAHWATQPNMSGLPAEFVLLVSTPGVYKVSLWWPRTWEPQVNPEVPVEIEALPCLLFKGRPSCAAVNQQSTAVNQSVRAGEWVDVGAPFAIPSSTDTALVFVRIRPQSPQPGVILADGVRLLKIG